MQYFGSEFLIISIRSVRLLHLFYIHHNCVEFIQNKFRQHYCIDLIESRA